MTKLFTLITFLTFSMTLSLAQNYQIAVLKYNGGGDWYANLETSLPNLIDFSNKNLGTNINRGQALVEVGSPNLFDYPFLHMTGHGNVVFSSQEAENLRNYLIGGGFLHIDDNYGMDEYIRVELKKVFPDISLIELPSNHAIYNQKYTFNGLPKIHEHDEKKAQAFGIVANGRLVCLYTFQTDLGDGWEDPQVHNDPPEKRKMALQMGANILMYAFMR